MPSKLETWDRKMKSATWEIIAKTLVSLQSHQGNFVVPVWLDVHISIRQQIEARFEFKKKKSQVFTASKICIALKNKFTTAFENNKPYESLNSVKEILQRF